MQDAFCRAWSRWDRVSTYDDPIGWVRRIAWNLTISNWRRRRTVLRFLARQRAEHVAGPTPDRLALTAILARLPMDQRRAVAMFYLAGLTSAEIAQECDVPDSTVRSWLRRARASLLLQLSDELDRR